MIEQVAGARPDPNRFLQARGGAILRESLPKQAHWAVFILSVLAAAVALMVSGRFLSSAVRSLHVAEDLNASAAATPRAQSPRAGIATQRDVVEDLPLVPESDSLTRFASKIAHELGLTLLQMQSESLKVEPNHLGQRRSTLQVRGDYLSTKKLLIALLAKFPGLTLEHWTIRHRAGGLPTTAAADVANRSDDESTIDLIQYSRPSRASS